MIIGHKIKGFLTVFFPQTNIIETERVLFPHVLLYVVPFSYVKSIQSSNGLI